MNPGSSPDRTILVTDSGLGGLSVYARIAEMLSCSSPWPRVSLVYFNSWPEADRGYNHYPDTAFRAGVFGNALNAMAGFRPDQILIACNTLSVIYPHTVFAGQTRIPVSGIIDTGVEMIGEALDRYPDSGVIIFGTPTTADSQIHARALTDKGVSKDRIISQGCVNLAGKIERNPFDPEVEERIRENATLAMDKGGDRFPRIFAALCCTHFGYRQELFSRALAGLTRAEIKILNPNRAMADKILRPEARSGAARPANIDYTVISRVAWEPGRIAAYETLFRDTAPKVAAALGRYRHVPDLFDVIP